MIERAKENHEAHARYVLAAEQLYHEAVEAINPLERHLGEWHPRVRFLREAVKRFKPHVAGEDDREVGGDRPAMTPADPLPQVDETGVFDVGPDVKSFNLNSLIRSTASIPDVPAPGPSLPSADPLPYVSPPPETVGHYRLTRIRAGKVIDVQEVKALGKSIPNVPAPIPPLDFKPWLERGILLAICGIIGLLAWLVTR